MNLTKTWISLDTPISIVVDESGVNMAEAKVRELCPGLWIYVDEVDGWRLIDDISRLSLASQHILDAQCCEAGALVMQGTRAHQDQSWSLREAARAEGYYQSCRHEPTSAVWLSWGNGHDAAAKEAYDVAVRESVERNMRLKH